MKTFSPQIWKGFRNGKTEKDKRRRVVVGRGFCGHYFGVPAWPDFEKGILIASVG